MEQPTQQHKTNVKPNDQKSHILSLSMLENGGHAQEISELVNALQKIGYFESFRVKDNAELGGDKLQKTPERKLKTHKKARYRHIKKYYKSPKQYQKERLRRKLCWLLSGKYRESEIAEMLGISRRTVIRDMNRIKPYYFRLSQSYFSKLEQQRIREFNAKLEGKPLWQQFQILTKAVEEQIILRQQREYNHHIIKFIFDLDHIDPDGYPNLRMWPQHPTNLTTPHILQFFFIKNGKPINHYQQITFDKMRG